MKSKYQSIRESINDYAKIALALYVIGGSAAYSDKTGHPSADITTGITQPSKLETSILNYFGLNIKENKNQEN